MSKSSFQGRFHATQPGNLHNDPLRALALTVDEPAPGEFRWRILERLEPLSGYQSLCSADHAFPAYDMALAAGYGELQRLVGPDLEHGPRVEARRLTV
jgi:hypothetical protein